MQINPNQMGLLNAFQMTSLMMKLMVLTIPVDLEAPRSWLVDAAQDLQARAECTHINIKIVVL